MYSFGYFVYRWSPLAFEEEVENLPQIAVDFSLPYLDDHVVDHIYFDQFQSFVEQGVAKNMMSRLGRDLSIMVQQNQKVIKVTLKGEN